MPQKSNQKGLAAVESLLILVIVIMIIGVGYYVWYSNQQAKIRLDKVSGTVSNSQGVNGIQQLKIGQNDIKRLGVRFVLPASLEGMSYRVSKVAVSKDKIIDGATLYDSALTPMINQCNPTYKIKNYELGYIYKYDGVYSTDHIIEVDEAGLLKQFSGFHILINFPNGIMCSTKDTILSAKVHETVLTARQQFVDAFKSTAIQIQ